MFLQEHEIETFLIKKEEPSKSRRKCINSNGRPRLWSEDDRFSPIPVNHKFSNEKTDQYRGEKFEGCSLRVRVFQIDNKISICTGSDSETKSTERSGPCNRNYSDPENNMQWTPEIPFENVHLTLVFLSFTDLLFYFGVNWFLVVAVFIMFLFSIWSVELERAGVGRSGKL